MSHQQNIALMYEFGSNGREVTPDYMTIPNQTQNAPYLKNLQAIPNIRTRNGTVGIPCYLEYTCRVRIVCAEAASSKCLEPRTCTVSHQIDILRGRVYRGTHSLSNADPLVFVSVVVIR